MEIAPVRNTWKACTELYIKVESLLYDRGCTTVTEQLLASYGSPFDCPLTSHAGVSKTGKNRANIKFAAFWCVFLREKKEKKRKNKKK